MVGQCPLEALVQVRILVAQPSFDSDGHPESSQSQPAWRYSEMEVETLTVTAEDKQTGQSRTARKAARRPRPRTARRQGEGCQAGPRAQADPQPERGQALQALLGHGQPAAGRGDRPAHRREGGRGQDAALCRRRSLLPIARERARRGCVRGAAHLLSGGPAPGGAAGDDRRAQAGLGGQDHGGGALLRLCPPGSQRPPARGHQRQADRRSADDRGRQPRPVSSICTPRRFRASSTFPSIISLPARCW